jgi:hypothetical protein
LNYFFNSYSLMFLTGKSEPFPANRFIVLEKKK